MICNNKVTETSDSIGTCSKCNAFQQLANCEVEVSAQVVLKSRDGDRMTSKEILMRVICGDARAVTPPALLDTTPFDVVVTSTIITDATLPT